MILLGKSRTSTSNRKIALLLLSSPTTIWMQLTMLLVAPMDSLSAAKGSSVTLLDLGQGMAMLLVVEALAEIEVDPALASNAMKKDTLLESAPTLTETIAGETATITMGVMEAIMAAITVEVETTTTTITAMEIATTIAITTPETTKTIVTSPTHAPTHPKDNHQKKEVFLIHAQTHLHASHSKERNQSHTLDLHPETRIRRGIAATAGVRA